MIGWLRTLPWLLAMAMTLPAHAQAMHDHGVPEKLGEVSFPVSCAPPVQAGFNRGVALLHSFAYVAAQQAFHDVVARDPGCAMGHWGLAMAAFHPVWTPALPPASFAQAQKDALQAQRMGAQTPRERGYIAAVAQLYQVGDLPDARRTLAYEAAMAQLSRDNPGDVEAQVFYAVALLSNAAPTDLSHARQKQAVAILQPLFARYPQHPGIAHYLIHACDSAELAQAGLPAARAYAQIAPSAPHALHMPSHIFTRLGLWDDSIASNLASQKAALAQGDTMGALHAMDYLVYAYLQLGRDEDANRVIAERDAMAPLDMSDFAIAYAATAMPIRVAVERARWAQAAALPLPATAPPSVMGIAVWARGIGLARTGHADDAQAQARRLDDLTARLTASGDAYWAAQTAVLADEVRAWAAQARGDAAQARTQMRTAADHEDAIEKRPVTPGPMLPAREQLGDLLLQQNEPVAARKAYQQASALAPGRRGAVQGEAEAAQQAD